MSDELILRQQTDRAAKAQAELESPVIAEAFDALEAAYVEAWKNTAPGDVPGRERAWTALTVITRVKGHMARMISDGRVAQAELDQIVAPPSAYR